MCVNPTSKSTDLKAHFQRRKLVLSRAANGKCYKILNFCEIERADLAISRMFNMLSGVFDRTKSLHLTEEFGSKETAVPNIAFA